jgi:hypothetical protein
MGFFLLCRSSESRYIILQEDKQCRNDEDGQEYDFHRFRVRFQKLYDSFGKHFSAKEEENEAQCFEDQGEI